MQQRRDMSLGEVMGKNVSLVIKMYIDVASYIDISKEMDTCCFLFN